MSTILYLHTCRLPVDWVMQFPLISCYLSTQCILAVRLGTDEMHLTGSFLVTKTLQCTLTPWSLCCFGTPAAVSTIFSLQNCLYCLHVCAHKWLIVTRSWTSTKWSSPKLSFNEMCVQWSSSFCMWVHVAYRINRSICIKQAMNLQWLCWVVS